MARVLSRRFLSGKRWARVPLGSEFSDLKETPKKRPIWPHNFPILRTWRHELGGLGQTGLVFP